MTSTTRIQTLLIRNALTGPRQHCIHPEKPGHDEVACGIRPECEGCSYPAHGFVCHFADGGCLRYPTTTKNLEE